MKYFFIISILYCSIHLYSQSEADSIIDQILFEENPKFDFYKTDIKFQLLYMGIGYDNKVLYAGRESGIENLSGYAAYLFYFHSSGWGIGLVGSGFDNIKPNYSSTILSAGYSGGLNTNKNIRYRFSYNRYFYTGMDYTQTTNNALTAGITLKKKWAGTRLDIAIPFSMKYVSKSISWDMYCNFSLLKRGSKFKLDFEPEISFYFGDETTYLIELEEISNEFIEYESQDFGWMNTYLKLPFSITRGNFDFELGYKYNIPRSLGQESLQNTSNFILSMGYMFAL